MPSDQINVDLIVKAITQGFDKISDEFKRLEQSNKKMSSGAKDAGLSFTELRSKLSLAAVAAQTFFNIAKEAYKLGEMGAQFERLGAAGDDLAKSLGSNYSEIISKLDEAAMGTVSNTELMLAANRAMMLGLGADADQLANLMEVAAMRGRAMGISTSQAFSDIVTGIGRMSPMILDNLGIIIDAENRYADYASAHGIAADAIDATAKRQILLNGVLKEGNKMLAEAGGLAADSATKYEQFGAAANNLKTAFGQAIDLTFGDQISGITEWIAGLAKAVAVENALRQATEQGIITQKEFDYVLTQFASKRAWSAADAMDWLTQKQDEYNASQQQKIMYGVMAQASYDRDHDATMKLGVATQYTTEQIVAMYAAHKRLEQQMSESAQAAEEFGTRFTDMGRMIENATPGLVGEIGSFMKQIDWAQAGGGIAEGVFEQLKSAIQSTSDPGKIQELENLIAPVLAAAFNAAIESGQTKEYTAKVDLAKMLGIKVGEAGDLLEMWSPDDLQSLQTQIMQIMEPMAFGAESFENVQSAAENAATSFGNLADPLDEIATTMEERLNPEIPELKTNLEDIQQPASDASVDISQLAGEFQNAASNAKDAASNALDAKDAYDELDGTSVYITITTEYITKYTTEGSPGGGGGGKPPPNCFAPDTPVTMANGEQWPIQDIQRGDHVLAWDEKTLEFGPGIVTGVIAKYAASRMRFSLANGAEFTCTPEHPFYQPGADYHGRANFIAARDLEVGDELYTPGPDGIIRIRIDHIEHLGGGPVYNLTVEPQHTYIAAGVLVHNVKAAQGLQNFVVPSGYPNDSYPIWVTSGERVNVETAGQRAAAQAGITHGGGGGGMMVNYNMISDFTTAEFYARAQARAARFARINSYMGG